MCFHDVSSFCKIPGIRYDFQANYEQWISFYLTMSLVTLLKKNCRILYIVFNQVKVIINKSFDSLSSILISWYRNKVRTLFTNSFLLSSFGMVLQATAFKGVMQLFLLLSQDSIFFLSVSTYIMHHKVSASLSQSSCIFLSQDYIYCCYV